MRTATGAFRLSLAVLGGWLAVVPATRAFAQTPAAEPTAPAAQRTEAKERFLRGLELAAQDSWDAALVEFLASSQLHSTRAALINAARSYQHMKRYAESIDMYGQLIEQFGAAIPADERKKVDATLGELRPFVGEIDVESDPAGSVVVVDGIQRGITPLPSAVTVNTGTHSVRVSHDGFEALETQAQVAGKQRKLVQAKLKRLARSGTLVVKESAGEALEVLIDGAVVGQTPWQGALGLGSHSVALRGKGERGSQPGAAIVRDGQTTALTLTATQLDAQLRVEPVPANARVDVDGVNVGAGVWQGRLASGSHRLEVYAEGHVPNRREVRLKRGRQELLRLTLERDLTNPMWAATAQSHLFVEATAGLALTPSLGAGADAACDRPVTLADGRSVDGCTVGPGAVGALAGARGGYRLTGGLGIEAFLGYLSLSQELRRNVVARQFDERFQSTDAKDASSLAGPAGALSVSYQFFKRTPLLIRIWGGVARARVVSELSGKFSGNVADGNGGTTVATSGTLKVSEPASNIWLPFAGPELRLGYRFSRRFVVDVGVAGFLFLGPAELRQGGSFKKATTDRASSLGSAPNPTGGAELKLGAVTFDEEKSVGTFVGALPSVGLRVEF